MGLMVTQDTVELCRQLYAEKQDAINLAIMFPSDKYELKCATFIREVALGINQPEVQSQPVVFGSI